MASSRRVSTLSSHLSATPPLLGDTTACAAQQGSQGATYPSVTLQRIGAPLTAQSPKVIYATKGKVCYIAINRPKVMNACDWETYAAISAAFKRFDADPALQCCIYTGVGERAFCAGSDIKANFAGGGLDDGGKGAKAAGDTNAMGAIGQVKKVVIAGINGHCNGGGFEQALACDIRVSVRGAMFGMGEVRLGLLPGGGGTQRLPRLIPTGRALELLVTGTRMSADEAFRLGAVDHMVDSLEELMPKCEAIAEQVVLSAPIAVQTIKRVAMKGLEMPLEDGIRLEARGQQTLIATEDSREGTNAFAQKRKPQWKGR